MAMSMKDLLSQSDEEEDDEPAVHSFEATKTQNTFTAKNNTTTIENKINSDSSSTTDDFSKRAWIKGHMKDSFKKLSSRKDTSVSLDTSLNETMDNEYFKPDTSNISKTSSEQDLKSGGVDGGSKTQWFKGQLNSYLSKSKNYYYNRGGMSSAVSEDSLNNIGSETEQEVNSKKHLNDNSNDIKNMTGKSSPVSIRKAKEARTTEKVVSSSLNSLTSDETHLPLIQKGGKSPRENTIKDSPESSPKDEEDAISKRNRIKNMVRGLKVDTSKTVKTNLSLSELLHSQRSLSSPVEDDLGETSRSLNVSPMVPVHSVRAEDEPPSAQELEILTDIIVKEDLKYHFKPTNNYPLTFYHLWLTSLAMFYYFLFDLPPFLSGFITGGLAIFLCGCGTIWFFGPTGDTYNEYKEDLKKFLLEDSKEKKQLEIFKSLPNPEVLQKPRNLKVWMSLAYEYDGTFKIELTKEIYAVVCGETLYLFLCKDRIEEKVHVRKRSQLKKKLKKETKKAAMERADKEKALFTFDWQYEIDLRKCSFHLKPDGLPIRRMWNKKYPMKLCIPRESVKKREIDFNLEDLTLNLNDIIEGIHEFKNEPVTVDEDQELFLFSNTGREKEDWFYRIQLCIKPLKHQVSFTDIRRQRLSKLPHESYPHYMIELMTESERVMQRNIKGKKMEPYLAWLNIFLGRAFWDFWHDKYWKDKLHQKIQSRLSKIDTPPFIKDITLKELNCGHNIPIIHKGSVPTLDEYGVWTDLQITYKGYFTLTLETHLNVDYYVNLVSGMVKQKGATDPKFQLSKLTKTSEIQDGNLSAGLDTTDDASFMNDSYDEGMLHDEIPEVYLDGIEQPDGLDSIDPIMTDPRTKAFLESNTGKKVAGLVGWLAKSKIAKRVAETEFAKKAYEKAYEKFRKMPIILKVEIQSVKGNLAVNLPPPPSNRLWFGFRGNPVIFITASPKVGDKQVRLTYLTSWIEKKLKEEFKKYLVLPSMQDLSIKLMDSQLKDLDPERPFS